MEQYNTINCYVDEVATDPDARIYLHLKFGHNSIWCELTNAHKNNGKYRSRLFTKALSRDKFLVGKLIGVFGKYPMRSVAVDSGFGITYKFDEILHSDINFID